MLKPLIKPFNLLLAGSSYAKSLINPESTEVRGMPVSVSTELTNNCNLRCPECSAGSDRMKRSRGFMETDLFKRVIGELKPYLYYINLYFQGEPMIHPFFFTFLEHSRGLHSTVSTNGHFLSAENSDKLVISGLKRLIVSIDGSDQESYSIYRVNGNLESVIEGLGNVSEARRKHKSNMKLEMQMLVNRFNETQIPEIKNLAKKFKATLTLKSMQIINRDKMGFWLPGKKIFRRYEIFDDRYSVKNSLENRCARLWFNPVITWDGKVLPCCFDKDAEYVMGDLNQESFRDIWNGPRYKVFRRALLKDRSMTEICRNCTSGLKGARY